MLAIIVWFNKEKGSHIRQVDLLFECDRVRMNQIVPEVVNELELGPDVHSLVDNVLQGTARRLPQIHLIQAEREELEEFIINNKIDLDPGDVGADHLQALTRDLGILVRVLLEQLVPGLDQIADGVLADGVLVKRDEVGLLLGARYLAIDHLAVNRHQELKVEVGVADAPLTRGDQVGEERRPAVGKVDERDEREQLRRLFS